MYNSLGNQVKSKTEEKRSDSGPKIPFAFVWGFKEVKESYKNTRNNKDKSQNQFDDVSV